MRRATIDKINSKYRGNSVSPAGFAARTSAIRTVSPVAPVVTTGIVSPTVVSTGPSVIAAPTSVYAGRSTIGRGTSVTGAPIFSSVVAPVTTTNTIIRNSRIGVPALRRSVVVNPPVYETVEHPPIYEVVTTPPKVYEIVTPVVEVTP